MVNLMNRVYESDDEKVSKDLYQIPGKTNPINIYAKIDGCQNFVWGEALNNPVRIPENWQITKGIIDLAHALEGVREKLGEPIHVTSWYRDAAANYAAGGVSNSEHMLGIAADFYCDTLSPVEIYDMLDKEWQGGLGIYPSWNHIDLGGWGRW